MRKNVVLTLSLTPEVSQWLEDLCAGKYPDKHFTSDPAEAVAAFIEAAAEGDLSRQQLSAHAAEQAA